MYIFTLMHIHIFMYKCSTADATNITNRRNKLVLSGDCMSSEGFLYKNYQAQIRDDQKIFSWDSTDPI